MNPAIQAAPTPLLGPLDEPGPQRVAFHISQHGQQMLVAGHGKRLEAALIDVAGADRAMMGVPALGMGDAQPAEEVRDFLPAAARGQTTKCQ